MGRKRCIIKETVKGCWHASKEPAKTIGIVFGIWFIILLIMLGIAELLEMLVEAFGEVALDIIIAVIVISFSIAVITSIVGGIKEQYHKAKERCKYD